MENWADYEYLSGVNGWSGATRYDDSDADVVFRVAATSLRVSEDPAENLDAIEDTVVEVLDAQPTVDLVLFGETITGLYRAGQTDAEDRDYQESVAETIPGPSTDRLGALAADAGIYLAYGMAERDGEHLYNALVLHGPDGGILAVHRKVLTVHTRLGTALDSPYDNGEGVTVAEIDGVPLGLVICNDMHSGAVAEGLTAAGVGVVLEALADTAQAPPVDGWSPIPIIWDAWVIQSNRVGAEGDLVYPGAAAILDPAGSVRASMNGEGWIWADVGVYL